MNHAPNYKSMYFVLTDKVASTIEILIKVQLQDEYAMQKNFADTEKKNRNSKGTDKYQSLLII